MHGNTPYAGREKLDVSPERRRALRRELTNVATSTRALLPDDFLVGGEISDGADGPRATVAVRPPSGSVVSTGFGYDEDADPTTLAQELAAGAVIEARRSADVAQTAS